MGWSENYNEQDIVADYTKPLKKLWDNLIPKTYPHILEFKTNRAVEVKVRRMMGPYHMDEHFIDYNCDIKIDNQPLIDNGWNGGEIGKELVKKSYGENYFHELRHRMTQLMKYAGLNFSQFDSGGKFNIELDEL